MVAVEHLVRFYVDQSAMGLGLALTAARKDTIHCGHPLIPECPEGVLDPDWIPAVAARGLIVIARDKKLRKTLRFAPCGTTGYECSASAASVTSRPGIGSAEW
jgi:PIN like domain